MNTSDHGGLRETRPFPCPACKCNNCRVEQGQQEKRGLSRLRECGNCLLRFYTLESKCGPERYDRNWVMGQNRNSREYRAKVDQYRLLKGLVGNNPNGREAIKLLVCLENARRKCGVAEE